MTPTPNPTAEQIVADAITAYWADEERSGPNRGPLAHDFACGEAATAALRAAGLLSGGAPSEEQVERAAKAYLNGGIYTLESDGEHHARMRAALTAAGVAPHDAEVAARQIDAPSVREAIGEVLADMEATAEGTHIASSLALLQEITDAAIRAAVSPPSRTAKRTGYETVGHGVGEHSQKITARAAEIREGN